MKYIELIETAREFNLLPGLWAVRYAGKDGTRRLWEVSELNETFYDYFKYYINKKVK